MLLRRTAAALLASVLAAALPAPAAAQPPPRGATAAPSGVDRARAQIAQGDYADAEKTIAPLLRAAASRAEATLLQAEIELRTGRYAEAA
ncbi:MAG TPA: tetratricopeptide repeat protein, partial [Candidatus Nanopelagicales bacterium]|nr:tetratricopeptide repeat protein [Candidatus Nanopelagicales bacterium]